MAASVAAVLLAGCQGNGASGSGGLLPASATTSQPAVKHGRQTLYVLVNVGTYGSYVALYDAYARTPKLLGKITTGLRNPGAIWVDDTRNV
jgi:hypothetical protein